MGVSLLVSTSAFGQYMLPDTLRAQQLLVRSLTYLEVGQPDEAISLLEEALSLVPNAPALLSTLAQAYRQRSDLHGASFYAEKACRQALPEVSYCHEWLNVLEAIGEASALQQAVELIQKHHAADPLALRYQAQWAQQRGDLMAARLLYEQLRDRYGADTNLYRALWPLQLATGDSLAALHTMEALLPFDASNAHLWRTLGTLYLRQGATEKARWALEHALRLAPADTSTAHLLAQIAPQPSTPTALIARTRQLITREPISAQTRQEARTLLQEVLRRDSTHVEALRLLAQLYRNERPDWSAELLTRSLQYDPRDLMAWAQTAQAWLEAGMPQRSAQIAEQGLFLFPDQPSLLRLATYAYLSLNQLNVARSHIEKLLHLLPEWTEHTPEQIAELYALQGHLLARLEQPDAARNACRQARQQISPPTTTVRLHCAVVDWLTGGRQEAALREARNALQAPIEPWMPETLGWLYLQAGQPEQARAVLQQALQAGPAGPLTYAYLGEALAQMGRLDEARRIWQEALQKAPDNAYLYRLLTTH